MLESDNPLRQELLLRYDAKDVTTYTDFFSWPVERVTRDFNDDIAVCPVAPETRKAKSLEYLRHRLSPVLFWLPQRSPLAASLRLATQPGACSGSHRERH